MIVQDKLTFRTADVAVFRQGIEDCFERMGMAGDGSRGRSSHPGRGTPLSISQ